MTENKHRGLAYNRNEAAVFQPEDIRPRWNYDVQRQLKDLETRQRWTKARTMGRVQHGNASRNTAKLPEGQTAAGGSLKQDRKTSSKKDPGRTIGLATCQETSTIISAYDGLPTSPHDIGTYNVNTLPRDCSVTPKNKLTRDKDDIKVAHREVVPTSTNVKTNKNDVKRKSIREHIMSLGKRDDNLNVFGKNGAQNDYIVIYEGPRRITQTSPERVRIEVIYSKERLKRSQNSTQLGRGLSRTTLHIKGPSCIDPIFYSDVKNCQSVTTTCLLRGTNRDDLHESFRRPTKSVKEIEDKEWKRNSRYRMHYRCQANERLPNRMLPMGVGRISESASIIILNPETLKTMSFSRFHPCRDTN